jgi:hypothetical protein
MISLIGVNNMATPLSLYLANEASITLPAANKLYITSGSPGLNATYRTFGNLNLGFFEVTAQGLINFATGLASIGNPSGLGFLYDSTALEGNQFVAGTWSNSVRLNASEFPTFTQAGDLTADIYKRVFRRTNDGTYYNIITDKALAQDIPLNFTTYTLTGVTTSSPSARFAVGDKVYIDIWVNVTVNNNGASGDPNNQGIRLNRLSTDTSTHIGDPSTVTVTPGYQAVAGPSTSVSGARRREDAR